MSVVSTIRQVEGRPASYPGRPTGLSPRATALDGNAVWQRIESYIAWRWTERTVEWTVVAEGCGEWTPPLAPALISTTEAWRGDAWQAVVLPPSPLGGYVVDGGSFRLTGIVGADAGEPPAAVVLAFARLSEYLAADAGVPGASNESIDIPDIERREISRSASWLARAMANSGAGDLLRPYRRV